MWKLFGWFRRLQLWATGDWQLHHNNMPVHASCPMQRFWQNWCFAKSPCPRQPRSGDLWLPAFPKTEIIFGRKRFQTIDRIQENTRGQLMVTGRTGWGPKVPTLKGTEESLSYVPCFFYLVSSSINVSNFYLTWLRTFWTDLIHQGTDRRTSVILYSSWHLTVILNEVESNWRILTRGVLWSDLYFDKSILAAVLRIDWGAQE